MCAHFCRYTLTRMEGHSLAVGHMQRLSKTKGCLQTLQDQDQEVERVLANVNANLEPKEASPLNFVLPRAALAERQCTICTGHAGCRQVHLLSTLPAVFVMCYHINFAPMRFQECSPRRRVLSLQVDFCNCTVLFCLTELMGEFVHSRVDRLMKRCLEVPSRITVVREEHFVPPKARPSFSLLSPRFRTDSLRCPCASFLASGTTRRIPSAFCTPATSSRSTSTVTCTTCE